MQIPCARKGLILILQKKKPNLILPKSYIIYIAAREIKGLV
jgi:hypothetical protein